ncbi:MAG TPA: universal stress protein [Candidatus Limnocylindria bacterium]|nr:universal stress protein [Candidatus Limnocylindria bacterium]
MSTIVVGYVDTPEGRAALRRGVEEAKLRNSRLVVVNSSKDGPQTNSESIVATGVLESAREELAGVGLEYDLRGLVRGLEVSEDVVDVARAEKAALLVIGLRRRSPVGKLILGSNSQRILLDADCAVLAVKAEADE